MVGRKHGVDVVRRIEREGIDNRWPRGNDRTVVWEEFAPTVDIVVRPDGLTVPRRA